MMRSSDAPTPVLVDGSEHYLALTLPSREHKAYAAVLELIKRHGFLAEPSNGQMAAARPPQDAQLSGRARGSFSRGIWGQVHP